MIRFRLAELLAERDMTGYRLAKASGLGLTTVYRMARLGNGSELERLDLATLDRICEPLGVQPGDLLTHEHARAASAPRKPGRPRKHTEGV